jgi:hypothetical protein
VCVCEWSCGRRGHEQQKREEADEKEEQHEDQLEEVSLLKFQHLQSNNGSRGLLLSPWALNYSKGLLPSPSFLFFV